MRKKAGETKAELEQKTRSYVAFSKPQNSSGPTPTMAGMRIYFGCEPPDEAKAHLERFLESQLYNGVGEALHGLRKHFGWTD